MKGKMNFLSEKHRNDFLEKINSTDSLYNAFEVIENHFSNWPFSPSEEDVIKRFLLREPEGKNILSKFLINNPGIPLKVETFELISRYEISGITLFDSFNYVLKEHYLSGLILIEQNTCLTDLSPYTY